MLFAEMCLFGLMWIFWCVEATPRMWGKKHMDGATSCEHAVINNDDMEKDDYYIVLSDHWHGQADWPRYPAECSKAFDFGDRSVTVIITVWSCEDDNLLTPFLAIYDDCSAYRNNLLMLLNCSSEFGEAISVSGKSSCVTIYHYRGQTKTGYYFELKVEAGEAFITFPVGGIAAIFILTIVGLLVCGKILCVITGYERRLPNINFDLLEDQKRILEAAGNEQVISVLPQGAHIPSSPIQPTVLRPQTRTSPAVPASSSMLQPLVVPSSEAGPVPSHTVLRLSRSGGSSISGASSIMLPNLDETLSDIDLDSYLEATDAPPPHPRLKRYPSAKASSMFRHK